MGMAVVLIKLHFQKQTAGRIGPVSHSLPTVGLEQRTWAPAGPDLDLNPVSTILLLRGSFSLFHIVIGGIIIPTRLGDYEHQMENLVEN